MNRLKDFLIFIFHSSRCISITHEKFKKSSFVDKSYYTNFYLIASRCISKIQWHLCTCRYIRLKKICAFAFFIVYYLFYKMKRPF